MSGALAAILLEAAAAFADEGNKDRSKPGMHPELLRTHESNPDAADAVE